MLYKKLTYILCSVIIAAGLIGIGLYTYKAAFLIKSMNRVLTVKGLSEQDVVANLGIWEINYREVGTDLIQLNQRLNKDQEQTIEFLKQHGFELSEISRANMKVEDRLANIYTQSNSQNSNDPRYVLTGGVRIRTDKVNFIQQATQEIDKLIQQGVPLVFDAAQLSPNPSYYYTQLDAIRPEMLTKAIASARAVAEQFAKEAGVNLDTIQRANQGQFQIMGRDTSTMNSDWSSNESALGTVNKRVRLVTTLDYRLK